MGASQTAGLQFHHGYRAGYSHGAADASAEMLACFHNSALVRSFEKKDEGVRSDKSETTGPETGKTTGSETGDGQCSEKGEGECSKHGKGAGSEICYDEKKGEGNGSEKGADGQGSEKGAHMAAFYSKFFYGKGLKPKGYEDNAHRGKGFGPY